MTAFERRLAKVEAEHQPPHEDGLRVRFWTSPDGMTDYAEQKAWLAAQVAADREQVPGLTLNVHFVRAEMPIHPRACIRLPVVERGRVAAGGARRAESGS